MFSLNKYEAINTNRSNTFNFTGFILDRYERLDKEA